MPVDNFLCNRVSSKSGVDIDSNLSRYLFWITFWAWVIYASTSGRIKNGLKQFRSILFHHEWNFELGPLSYFYNLNSWFGWVINTSPISPDCRSLARSTNIVPLSRLLARCLGVINQIHKGLAAPKPIVVMTTTNNTLAIITFLSSKSSTLTIRANATAPRIPPPNQSIDSYFKSRDHFSPSIIFPIPARP